MPFEGRPIRWGVLGCGQISRDFVSAASALSASESMIVACAARKAESAAAFAAGFSKANGCENMRSFGSYDALLADAEVDVVYIGTVANTHEELCMAALNASKHVLVEKPITLDADGARRVVEAARAKGLFLMEGMWTRCFPAVRKAREILQSGALGEVVAVAADFGWPAIAEANGPHARCLDPISGGVTMDIAMYPLGHVLLASGGSAPSRVVATGATVGPDGACVDWSVAASLSGFPAPADPCFTASVLITLRASTPEEAVITGTKGTLRIHSPAHTPTRLTLKSAISRTEWTEEVFDFPLPPAPEGAILPWNYPSSEGFVYEAEAVVKALRAGLTESTDWTHEESIATMVLVDALRTQTKQSIK